MLCRGCGCEGPASPAARKALRWQGSQCQTCHNLRMRTAWSKRFGTEVFAAESRRLQAVAAAPRPDVLLPSVDSLDSLSSARLWTLHGRVTTYAAEVLRVLRSGTMGTGAALAETPASSAAGASEGAVVALDASASSAALVSRARSKCKTTARDEARAKRIKLPMGAEL